MEIKNFLEDETYSLFAPGFLSPQSLHLIYDYMTYPNLDYLERYLRLSCISLLNSKAMS